MKKPARSGSSQASLKRWPRAMWIKEIKAFQDSGLSKKEYAAKHDIPEYKLRRWIRILGSKAVANVAGENSILPAFLPVNVVNPPDHKPADTTFLVEVDLANGRRLRARFGQDADMKRFADVLDAIDGGARC
jgi:hypothetical protein